MRRYQRLVRRKWRFRLALGLPIVVLVILASAILSSGAVFTSSSANPANIFSAGILKHTNSKSGTAILTATKMKPGDTVQGTVTITNDGDIPGTFSLSTSNLSDAVGANSGKLSDVLKVKIVDGTTQIYDGPINRSRSVRQRVPLPSARHTRTSSPSPSRMPALRAAPQQATTSTWAVPCRSNSTGPRFSSETALLAIPAGRAILAVRSWEAGCTPASHRCAARLPRRSASGLQHCHGLGGQVRGRQPES